MVGAEWRHLETSSTWSSGVGKGFLGLVHLVKALAWVVSGHIDGEKHLKLRK